MRYLLFILTLLIFSCEKENCRICKTKVFEPGKEAVITTDLICNEVQEGYFYSIDSLGRVGLTIITCKE